MATGVRWRLRHIETKRNIADGPSQFDEVKRREPQHVAAVTSSDALFEPSQACCDEMIPDKHSHTPDTTDFHDSNTMNVQPCIQPDCVPAVLSAVEFDSSDLTSPVVEQAGEDTKYYDNVFCDSQSPVTPRGSAVSGARRARCPTNRYGGSPMYPRAENLTFTSLR